MIDAARLQGMNPVEESFLEYHLRNPHVYAVLVDLARRTAGRGHSKVGIDMLHAVARWNSMVGVTVGDEFLLNNNHRPYYARLIMLGEEGLFGLFDVREIRVPSVLEDMYLRRLREQEA